MALSSADRLRQLLGERIPAGGVDSDTFFTDDEVNDLLLQGRNSQNRAAYLGWLLKAAEYANMMNVTEGNASRQAATLYDNAMKQVQFYERATTVMATGRTRIGRIRRRLG